VNPVVIDASAGVELAADTRRGRALRAVLPADAVLDAGAVLRGVWVGRREDGT
jgi:hypothetical protein